jgi:hypothetical protein
MEEKEMSHTITLNDVRAEAEKQGYSVTETGTTLRVTKKHVAHINQSFALDSPLSIDLRHARNFVLLQAYYWVRGYHLRSDDDAWIELQRGMHHPAFDQKVRIAEMFDYVGIRQLRRALTAWVELVEQSTQGHKGR